MLIVEVGQHFVAAETANGALRSRSFPMRSAASKLGLSIARWTNHLASFMRHEGRRLIATGHGYIFFGGAFIQVDVLGVEPVGYWKVVFSDIIPQSLKPTLFFIYMYTYIDL